MRTLLAALVLAATPGVHHTAAGNATARSSLLRHADLGASWITGAPPKKAGALVCGNATPPRDVVEIGAAVSPTYRQSAGGPFVSQSVFVYDSAAGAARYYRNAARPNALACLAQSVASGGDASAGISFTVAKREVRAAPSIGVTASAYRVVGHAVAQAQRVTVYVDVILLQRRTEIAQLSFSSFSSAVAAADETRIARAAAGRLH
jgi:hypothetical protein